MEAALEIREEGRGPPVLLIHGTAADATTFSLQFRSLASHLQLLTWNRRLAHSSVSGHVQDAIALMHAKFSTPPWVVGSSFGAVVALELARQHASWVRGLVLLEPPLAPNDLLPSVPDWFLPRFDELAATQGGPAAGEYFLRTVLGEEAVEKMPKPFLERSKNLWAHIRQDSLALKAFKPGYDSLKQLHTPTLLLGGARSAPVFHRTLKALAETLPRASIEMMPHAGHMLHAEAHRAFNARLLQFVGDWAEK